MVKWTPKDVLALVITASCLFLIYKGMDSWVKYTLLVVVSLYYGVDIASIVKALRPPGDKKGDK